MSFQSYDVPDEMQIENNTAISYGTFYSNIRNMRSMDELAKFLTDKYTCIPKYKNAIVDTIKRFTTIEKFYVDMVVNIIREMEKIMYIVDTNSMVLGGCSDQYRSDKEVNRHDDAKLYFEVLEAYVIKLASYGVSNISEKNPSGIYGIKNEAEMVLFGGLVYSCCPINIADMFYTKSPEMKEFILKHIVDSIRYCENIPNVHEYVNIIKSIQELYEINILKGDLEKFRERISDGYSDEEIRKILDGILEIGFSVNYAARRDQIDYRRHLIDHCIYTIRDYEQALNCFHASLLGEKYFGEDCILIYNEPKKILQDASISQITDCADHYIGKHSEIVKNVVERLNVYTKVITSSYKVNETLVRAIIKSSLYNEVNKYTDPSMRKLAMDIGIKYSNCDKKTQVYISDEKRQGYIDDFYMFLSDDEKAKADIAEESYIESLLEIATESRSRRKIRASVLTEKATNKAYGLYRGYKERENKLDYSLTTLLDAMKKLALGDIRSEIIEGKRMSVLSIAKKIISGLILVGSLGKVKGALALIVRYFAKKKISNTERKIIISELDGEIEICERKIEHAANRGDRKNEINLMRIKNELVRARSRIRLGLSNAHNVAYTVKDMLEKGRSQ